VEWDHTWKSLTAPPRVVEKGIFLSTGEQKKKVFGLFGYGESGKLILIQAEDLKEVSSVFFFSCLTPFHCLYFIMMVFKLLTACL
jgi:hypothetical protein